MTRVGIEKPGPRVQRTAGQKQPRGLFLGRGRFRAAEADVAGVVGVGCCCLRLAEGLTEACGPGMPGPYREVKKGRVSGRGKVRRRGQDPSLRMEDSMAADAKRAGRACPAPTGSLKK